MKMKKTAEFENILNECLERMLRKGATVEQCLAWYPEHAAALEPLLRTALEARQAAAVEPRPDFRERARYQFQAALRETEAKKSRRLFTWQPAWVVAVILVVVLLTGSGTVAAASGSLPDEPLYMVKLAAETVQLTLTPSDLGKAELYAKFADRRVAEIIKMADEGKVEQVERLTHHLNSQLIAMADLAAPEGETSDAASLMMQAPAEETTQPKLAVPAATPAPAAKSPEQLPAPVPAPEEMAAGAPEVLAPAEGEAEGSDAEDNGRQDKQAKWQATLAERAAENMEALRAEIEKAPESVRPALRRALEEAMAGYERNIRHWGKDR